MRQEGHNSIKKIAEHFRARLDGFARDEGACHRHIKYVPQCGPVCRNDRALRKIHDDIVETVNRVCKAIGGSSKSGWLGARYIFI